MNGFLVGPWLYPRPTSLPNDLNLRQWTAERCRMEGCYLRTFYLRYDMFGRFEPGVLKYNAYSVCTPDRLTWLCTRRTPLHRRSYARSGCEMHTVVRAARVRGVRYATGVCL